MCATSEYQKADSDLNSVYAEALVQADPHVRQSVRSAERAWIRYRDAYLASLTRVVSCPAERCQAILLARVIRGRIAELTRTLPRANRASPAVEASCDGYPGECQKAHQWLGAAQRRSVANAKAAVRERLNAAHNAWLGYLAAETEAMLAVRRSVEPSIQARLRESIRLRLSLDRMAHLATFEAYQKNRKERCRQLETEAKMLANIEAGCDAGQAQSCTSLGQALDWGWYSIDRDRPRARALYEKACGLKDGTACAALASIFGSGRGVAVDLAQTALLLQRGCDAGDANNCQSLARLRAKGEGLPEDLGRAADLWQRACDLSHSDKRPYWGDGHPCQNLARALESGDPVPRDAARALALHEAACEEKLSDSCVAAARLLRQQEGFDQSRVISLYGKGCSGYRTAGACVEMGDLYRDGRGFSQDKEQAIRWYQSACDDGYVPGCRDVSTLTGAPMGDPDDRIPDRDYIRTVRFIAKEHTLPLRLRLFGDDYGAIFRLQVFDEGAHRVTQVISVPELPGSDPGAALPVRQVDLNFDGYKDLALLHYAGANNHGDFIWIFDPEHRRFRYHAELSDLPNLEPVAARQVLTSYYHFSAGEGDARDYRWVQGKAVLVSEDSRYFKKNGTDCLEHVTKKRIKGRMVETGRSCE